MTADSDEHAVNDDDRLSPTDDRADMGDDATPDPPGGLAWPRVVAAVAAFAWLGGAVGWFVAQDRPPGPGSVDAGFYLDMAAHHEQGVQLAIIELANGENPVVLGFAQEVVIFQQYELGRMDEQLRVWGLGRGDREDVAMGWMDAPVPHDAMPGLATDEQIEELQAAEGQAADALFLELLAEHHRGAVHMASYAAENADNSAVSALAQRMARNQAIEINEFAQTAQRFDLDADIEPYPLEELPQDG